MAALKGHVSAKEREEIQKLLQQQAPGARDGQA